MQNAEGWKCGLIFLCAVNGWWVEWWFKLGNLCKGRKSTSFVQFAFSTYYRIYADQYYISAIHRSSQGLCFIFNMKFFILFIHIRHGVDFFQIFFRWYSFFDRKKNAYFILHNFLHLFFELYGFLWKAGSSANQSKFQLKLKVFFSFLLK